MRRVVDGSVLNNRDKKGQKNENKKHEFDKKFDKKYMLFFALCTGLWNLCF